MEDWSERLNKAADAKGWPVRGRPGILSQVSGVSVDNCEKYLQGGVAQPRGKTMARLATAVGLTEAELRGLNGPFMTASLPSPGGFPELARLEEKMDKEQRAIWQAIGDLVGRLNRIESGMEPTKPKPHRPPRAPRT